MTIVASDPFEKMIRDAGEAWLIDWYAPSGEALPHLRDMLRRAHDAARARLGASAPSLSPETLAAAYSQNPHKVKAFLQAAGSIKTPDMLVMVWRVLQGSGIASVRVDYAPPHPFLFRVTLASSEGQPSDEVYESHDIEDAAVLRHFGILKMDTQGVFDGFYAFGK